MASAELATKAEAAVRALEEERRAAAVQANELRGQQRAWQQEQEAPRRRSMAARLPPTKGSPSTSHEPSLARRMPKVVAKVDDNQLSST